MFKILIGLMFIATSAWANVHHPHSYATVTITWQTVPDVNAACEHEYRKLGMQSKDGHRFLGCAIKSLTHCLVITGENTTHEILGHEMQHCYDGAYHN